MLIDILIFIVSIPILMYSSDFFTDNAAKLARSMGVSQFFIGITIIGIGTSLPEIMVTGYASFTGESGIVVGNIIGSNITNIALILGAALLIRKTVISDDHMIKESIVHLLILILGTIIVLSGDQISRPEGMVLITVYFLYIFFLMHSHKRPEEKDKHNQFIAKRVANAVVGLVGVLLGSKLLVDSTVEIANHLGISSAVIALTIVALGTSLPELAVSISAARRGFTMLILGNIVGSNVTNLMLALGTAALIKKVMVTDIEIIHFNLGYMLLLSVILVAAVRKKAISRWWGGMYLLMYLVFISSFAT